MTFRLLVQLCNANTLATFSRGADLTEIWCMFQSIWERLLMYSAMKFANFNGAFANGTTTLC